MSKLGVHNRSPGGRFTVRQRENGLVTVGEEGDLRLGFGKLNFYP